MLKLGALQSFCDPRLNFEQSLGESSFPFPPSSLAGVLGMPFAPPILTAHPYLRIDDAFMISDYFKKEHVEREKGRKEMRAANRLYAELGGRSPAEPALAV